MRAHVLADGRLTRLAGRFVRLDVNTEEPRNAAFLERFPIDAWPTLMVVDPADERVVLRRAGTATVTEVLALAREAEALAGARRTGAADVALARAEALLAERRHAEAAAAFQEALDAGGARWRGRARAAEALVQARGFSGDAGACVADARAVLRFVPPGPGQARVAAQGLACALDLAEGPERTAAQDALEPAVRRALGAEGVLADDRSWLYDVLSESRAARGDAAGSRTVARAWLRFLEAEALRARTPVARAALDGQRLEAAMRLGQPRRAEGALLASERDLPGDFVPPANLATLYLALDRPADALAAADRALALAGGPRRIRVLVTRARAQEALGDRGAARETLRRALSEAAALPDATRPRRPAAEAERRLGELGAGAGE
jgi:tetratricopeptide (TPR) repeat protein